MIEAPTATTPTATATPVPAGTRVRAHVPALDGIRGLAILLVMASHLLPSVVGPAPLSVALKSGWIGVDLFFVLSGFLITGILEDSKGNPHYFRNFYIRRVLRIFPLYYGSLIVFALIVPRLHLSPALDPNLGRDQPWLWLFGANLLVPIHGWYHLSIYWSLAVEEHFYLVWPAVVAALGRRSLMIVCAVLIVATIPIRIAVGLRSADAAYTLTPCRMDGLAIGALIALAIRGPDGPARVAAIARRLLPPLGLAILGLAAWRGRLSWGDPAVIAAGFTLLGGFFGALLVRTISSPPGSPLDALFSHPLMRFFGKYNYGLYIYHSVMTPVFFKLASPERMSALLDSRIAGVGAFLTASVGGSVAIAWLSFNLFEAPFLRLKRYFPD